MNSIERRPEQLVRVNPYQGLMIDASIWTDAHASHRDELRLHQLALHGWGIVEGLDIIPRDGTTVAIQPGLGIDPAGNFIIVDAPYDFQLVGESGAVYLVLQYREVPTGPSQVGSDGVGRSPRLRAAFSIVEERVLPSTPYLELARITLDPRAAQIQLAHDPAKPAPNELDLRYRAHPGRSPAHNDAAHPTGAALKLTLGMHGGSGWDCHREGFGLLAREVELVTGKPVRRREVALPQVDDSDLLYLSGSSALALDALQLAALSVSLARGAVVVGDACAHGPDGVAGAHAFGESFVALGRHFDQPLATPNRDHPLLRARYVFGQLPMGSYGDVRVLEGGGLVYCAGDYGCAWQGGAADRPLPRGTIRDALEFGVNLALFAGPDRRGKAGNTDDRPADRRIAELSAAGGD